MAEQLPDWLVRMQNGTIGEARAKAFLIDRFWILERSVDIDGVDLLIQRRITRQNRYDRENPRYGLVQVKFFGSVNTSHYIRKEYVCYEDDSARDDFFVLCHSGDEGQAQTFILTADEILKNFNLSDYQGVVAYRLPYTSFHKDSNFLVSSSKLALDRIENQLRQADFTRNRQFIS
ncbi:hypothetical protein [Dyadobacter luticola]|uniref:DUF4365 domain-containing protein n=1 Tax=Dyadobacter luticola TaxID=1979387 RepID=A0A5R9L1V3_9BACT|nr:hypothetical protein [Dyadobacter luticola]TLV02544.1 hypothetical protein FEN17_02675 [Dyadobacter luticola]